MTVDIEKLRFTLEAMSEAATDLIRTDSDKIDLAWVSAFVATCQTTLEAIED